MAINKDKNTIVSFACDKQLLNDLDTFIKVINEKSNVRLTRGIIIQQGIVLWFKALSEHNISNNEEEN